MNKRQVGESDDFDCTTASRRENPQSSGIASTIANGGLSSLVLRRSRISYSLSTSGKRLYRPSPTIP